MAICSGANDPFVVNQPKNKRKEYFGCLFYEVAEAKGYVHFLYQASLKYLLLFQTQSNEIKNNYSHSNYTINWVGLPTYLNH